MAELQVFYRAVTFLNETRSIIFITNRELSAWIDAAEDKHLFQTLLDRITANCQIVHLTDR
ncbi:ATP-binding protein [Acetivibrio straminisolvens]|jgi:urocanate hydratase|uniref:Mobile element protein n=1 Tax=Acetivibrio straminisolvens JCM 21531 TaxID=1294263 RepID=W4V5M8_9FIRM|nr:ATP-binding protein [Acetivibrio straminisolvens]GAE88486.1 mobile element protein [Acetivibrio straminisolvens JCM 21531]